MPAKKDISAQPSTSLDFFETHSLFRVTEEIAAGLAPNSPTPKTNYQALMHVCQEKRTKHRMRPADATFASVAVDLRNNKQSRFGEALVKYGIATDLLDYRWTYVAEIGQRPDGKDHPLTSLAPQATYLLGLLAGRAEVLGMQPEIVLVTGVFDVYRPLMDFVQNRHGKAVLLFPMSLLDPRWSSEGLFEPEYPIVFEDLTPDAGNVFGVSFQTLQARRQLPPSGGMANI